MANSQDQQFITQFNAEVKHAYQLESKLLPLVRAKRNVIGSTARFPKIGKLSAYQKSRNTALTVQEASHSYVDITIADWRSDLMVDKLDELKTNIDTKNEYVQTVAKALAKKIDGLIIAAGTSGSVTTTTNSGAFSLARATEIVKYFTDKGVPAEDRICVVGSNVLEDMLNISTFTSADYNTIRALMNGSVEQFLGMKWVVLPVSAEYIQTNTTPTPDTTVNFAFHKDALAVAVGADIQTRIEWSPDYDAWWVKATASIGAGIVDADGVVEFEVDI